MATKLKKISDLSVTSQFDGNESVPLLKGGSNPRTTLADLKEYFRDSSLVIFSAIDNAINPTVSSEPFGEDYPIRNVVYLSSIGSFVERVKRTMTGRDTYYSSSFSRSSDFMDGEEVRRDRVFFNTSDKLSYTFSEEGLISTMNVIEPTLVTIITDIL